MSPSDTSHHMADELFPPPSLPPSQLCPQRLPGAGLESLAALLDVLMDNHQRYHIFFNSALRFHNHITHRALAIYALGGSGAVIRDYYARDARIQRPVIPSPEPIMEENFFDHLGDDKFYQAYVTFFSQQVSENGARGTIEKFIFSEEYNFRKGRDANAQPEMLSRLFQGLVHPLIHVGYGLEFGLKGMLIEGLAQTAIHHVRIREYIPSSLLTSRSANDVENIANRLSSFVLDVPAITNTPLVSKTGSIHVFDIVARILKDDRLGRMTYADYDDKFTETLAKYSPIITGHTEKWTVHSDEVERKVEELIWLSSLVYAVGGSTQRGFQSDFFLMHMVTSSLFLPSLIAYLSPRSQVLLLRGYLIAVLTWWTMRGRPALNIKSFMETTSVTPSVPTSPAPGTPLTTAETTPTPNPFLPVLQSAVTHPQDHVAKIQRAFAHFDTTYGRRPAGYFKGTELEGAEFLDGSLFLRAALLTADAVGWVREGQEPKQFSMSGFYA